MSYFTLGNYITIQGRLRRKDWWMMRLVLTLVYLVLLALTIPLSLAGLTTVSTIILITIVMVIVIIGVMLDIRRYHDRDKSGWWLLILFIPIIGTIWVIVEVGFLKGTTGLNKFGADPTLF